MRILIPILRGYIYIIIEFIEIIYLTTCGVHENHKQLYTFPLMNRFYFLFDHKFPSGANQRKYTYIYICAIFHVFMTTTNSYTHLF